MSKYKNQAGLIKPVGLVGLCLSASLAFSNQCQNPIPVWEDNFDGNSLDTSKWEAMIGDGCSYGICGWGNNELQYYKSENATVANGVLTITAKKERVQSKAYTSARLRTANMPNGGQWTHGRFEARMKIPNGTGMWPAFWMLPTDPDVGWPVSGEIDIMEATGQADMIAFGTIHYGQPYPDNEFQGNRILKQPDRWSDDFHVYAVEWEPNELRWYVDDVLYSVKRPDDLSDPAYWTFENYQYHFLLNVAVGGNIGGTVDDSQLPQTMDVDYVRVYNAGQPSLTGEHLPEPNSIESYSVVDESGTGSTYTWSVPNDASIISGAGTSSVTVQWGSQSGNLTVNVSNSCGDSTLAIDAYVAPQLATETILDNFDSQRNITYTQVDGVFDQAASNPSVDSVNDSAVVARYVRSAEAQYDVIIADVADISDASPFISGEKAFYLDLFTSAPIGTEILVQLENSGVATATNYPSGRHSKYVAHVETQNSWQRLKFKLEDRIDGATGDQQVNSLVVLFAANSFTGDEYYFDNFEIYGKQGEVASSMVVAAVTTGTQSIGKGQKIATATVTVLDDLGAPVEGATVVGNFSGTISESNVSGVTGPDGKVTLSTSTAASGSVSVSFCVSNVSHSSLAFDSAGSQSICQ